MRRFTCEVQVVIASNCASDAVDNENMNLGFHSHSQQAAIGGF